MKKNNINIKRNESTRIYIDRELVYKKGNAVGNNIGSNDDDNNQVFIANENPGVNINITGNVFNLDGPLFDL
jgi:hypothetical protein